MGVNKAAMGVTLLGAVLLVAGVGLTAFLLWGELAGTAAVLLVSGGGLLTCGLLADFDRDEGSGT